MQAVILAAGMGRRLGELTMYQTKCMVQVNGIRLIERTLRILDKKNLSKIVIVIGYKGDMLRDFIGTLGILTPICYLENADYKKTNNIYSLSLAAGYLAEEDTLLLESDIIFEESLIDCLLTDRRSTLALVDQYQNGMNGTCLLLDDEDNIVEFSSGKLMDFSKKHIYYKTVNIYKFSKEFNRRFYLPLLNAYITVMGENEYYESVIKLCLLLDVGIIKAKCLHGEKWYEIDDKQDLDIAAVMFITDPVERYRKLSGYFGGYWRYPHLLDFCYLVNPYFPTETMAREIASGLDEILTQYPSGMEANCLLASKNFGVAEDQIVAGNGAAELIKELLCKLEGKMGILAPTFEEYPNRYGRNECVMMDTSILDFIYGAQDIIEYFSDKGISSLVVVNPDNPSGNYMSYGECAKVASWCEDRGIQLILDESFSDFADGDRAGNTAMKEEFIEAYPNAFVVKSISKSYGVPGLRLGIMVSGRTDIIASVKKAVPIWNLNSFAEFFMQILGKYEQEYAESLGLLKKDRERLFHQLSQIGKLKVYPSQANYFMCEIIGGITSERLAAECLEQNLLVKDLSGKIRNGKQYIRIAVRKKDQNDRLVSVLEQILYVGSEGCKTERDFI